MAGTVSTCYRLCACEIQQPLNKNQLTLLEVLWLIKVLQACEPPRAAATCPSSAAQERVTSHGIPLNFTAALPLNPGQACGRHGAPPLRGWVQGFLLI
jgi:hypothetical protein